MRPITLDDLASRSRGANEADIRRACASAYLGGDRCVARVLGRYKMFLDTNDIGFSTHLLLDGYWEMWTTQWIAASVRPGMTCVDIGANLGYFTLLMADLAGPLGVVHAFEPNPSVARRLRDTVSVNGFADRAHVHEVALGAEDGTAMRLVVPDGEPKNGYLVPAGDAGHDDILYTRRFDGFAELADADFIKIDADTAEEAIWAGMRGLLGRGRPLTIVLEFVPGRYVDPAGFLERIMAGGFSLSRLDYDTGLETADRADVLAAPAAQDQMLVLTR